MLKDSQTPRYAVRRTHRTYTPQFKAELVAFRALPVVADAPATPTRAFVVDSTIGHDRSQGPLIHTGNDQDFAVKGPGFFAVQGPDGQEAAPAVAEPATIHFSQLNWAL